MSATMLPVAILAGGLAKRLAPLTESVPKALIDVNGEPFIAHQLRLLRDNRIERVILCVGHLGELIRDRVGTGARFGLQVELSFDGPRLLGTAGAIQQALPLLGDAFFVLYGDSYLPCEFGAVQAAFEKHGRPALMTVFRNENRWDKSNVEYLGGTIVAYDKRRPTPRMAHLDYGLGVFRRRAFDGVPAGEPYDLETLYQALLAKGDLAACEVHRRFYEIGSPGGLEETRRYLAGQAAPRRERVP